MSNPRSLESSLSLFLPIFLLHFLPRPPSRCFHPRIVSFFTLIFFRSRLASSFSAFAGVLNTKGNDISVAFRVEADRICFIQFAGGVKIGISTGMKLRGGQMDGWMERHGQPAGDYISVMETLDIVFEKLYSALAAIISYLK